MIAGLYDVFGRRIAQDSLMMHWLSEGHIQRAAAAIARTPTVRPAAEGLRLELLAAPIRMRVMPNAVTERVREAMRLGELIPVHVNDMERRLLDEVLGNPPPVVPQDVDARRALELLTTRDDVCTRGGMRTFAGPEIALWTQGRDMSPEWAAFQWSDDAYRPSAVSDTTRTAAVATALRLPRCMQERSGLTQMCADPREYSTALLGTDLMGAGRASSFGVDEALLVVLPDVVLLGPEELLGRVGSDISERTRFLLRLQDLHRVRWMSDD